MNQTNTNRHKFPRATQITMAIVLVLSSFTLANEASACAACGCLVSKDWQAQGISSEPGFSLGLSYDYIRQDQPMIGTHSASINALLSNNPNASEVEQLTTTSTTTLDVNYNDDNWGVDLQLPYMSRYHETYPDGTVLNTSQSNSLGDARVIGRYSGLSSDQTLGLMLGVKLPTGPSNITFSDGSLLDRSLQPGTGSTDVIVGVSKSGQVGKYGWFVQGLYQTAIATLSDIQGEYKPGDSMSLNIGVRYATFGQKVTPMLQINAVSRRADSGTAATPLVTGGELVYLTPGVSARLGGATTGFAFLQIPIYQNVNASDAGAALGSGAQLTAKSIVSLGIKHSF